MYVFYLGVLSREQVYDVSQHGFSATPDVTLRLMGWSPLSSIAAPHHSPNAPVYNPPATAHYEAINTRIPHPPCLPQHTTLTTTPRPCCPRSHHPPTTPTTRPTPSSLPAQTTLPKSQTTRRHGRAATSDVLARALTRGLLWEAGSMLATPRLRRTLTRVIRAMVAMRSTKRGL